MKNSRKVIIGVLICLNVGLLGALVHLNTTPAYAQPFRSTDYVVVTSKVASGWDALCVIDLEKQKLVIWKWDKTKKRLVALGGRDLPRDFKVRRPSR